MKQIWKFPLTLDGIVAMPLGAKVISAHEQGGGICVWAEVDPKRDKIDRQFSIYGTGWDLPDESREFIGTVLLHGGRFVFHVYEHPK